MDAEDEALFEKKQSFMFLVCQKKLKTDWSQHLVRVHSSTGNAQGLFRDLVEYYTHSNIASLTKSGLLTKITNTQYHLLKRSMKHMDFFVNYMKLLADYEELTEAHEVLPDSVKLTLFQNAVAGTPALHAIQTDNDKEVAHGRPPLTWQNYQTLVAAVCASLDHGETVTRTHRGTNLHEQSGDTDNEETNDDDDTSDGYEVHMAVRMKKELWSALSPEDRKHFNQLGDDAKLRILNIKGYADNKAQESNTHDLTTSDTEANTESSESETSPDSKDSGDEDDNKFIAMLTKSNTKKHPGDITRVLSKKNAKPGPPKKNKTGKVCVHEFITTQIPQGTPRGYEGSIVDRGSNHGILGNDATVIYKHPGSVTVELVEEGTTRRLRLVTGTAKVHSDQGPVMAIFHNYAHDPNRTTSIHSSIQVEHGGNIVNDRSVLAGGKQEIRSPSGHRIPLTIRNGLPRLDMRLRDVLQTVC